MAQKRARTQACKKHKMGNVRKKNWQGILQKINLFLPKAPVSSCWWRLHGMAWDSSGPRFRSPNKNYFTTEYKIKCRLCNDIYLVLSAEVTGVLIGQSEAEVSEDVGEDQEHLTFGSGSFSNYRNQSLLLLSLSWHRRCYIIIVFYSTFMILKGPKHEIFVVLDCFYILQ